MEILTLLQKQILRIYSTVPDKEAFYLTGGTALSSFFIKHRRSKDLDFFTSVEELVLPFSYRLESSLKREGFETERVRGFHSFVELSVHGENDSTVIHFALDSPFRFEAPAEREDFTGVKVDSLIDMAANKLLALFGRAALRDFIDVYFLANEYFSKKTLMEKAGQKDPGFDLYWLGVSMERLNEFPEDEPDKHLLVRPCPMDELKKFFNIWRKEIMVEISKGP